MDNQYFYIYAIKIVKSVNRSLNGGLNIVKVNLCQRKKNRSPKKGDYLLFKP